jgi:hypothetical protein
MPTIESLVNELNEICKYYVAQKSRFIGHESVSAILKEIEDQNYNLALPVLEINRPEYILLSDEGKMDFEKMLDIRKSKVEAIRKQKFEQAARLRNDERILEKIIRFDLFVNTGEQYCYLINKFYKTVIINDPEKHLKGMFRSP